MRNIFILLWGFLCCACGGPGPQSAIKTNGTGQTFNLNVPADNLRAFVKARASLDENQETVYYWSGTIYSNIPGEIAKPLFNIEAYSVARVIKRDTGYVFMSREAGVYRDIISSKILSKWYNPFIKDSVEVVPIWNDPVNFIWSTKSKYPWRTNNHKKLGANRISLSVSIPLYSLSPLKKEEFPENTRSDMYQALENFSFTINEDELQNPDLASAYSEVSWTRVGEFLPWMRMGDKAGNLLYFCSGYKMANGFDDIPQELREYILAREPQFQHAPLKYSYPNMNSWEYYKRISQK